MNQVIAAVMLFGIIAVVFGPLIAESGSQIFTRSASISDAMESSRLQTGQVMVATKAQQQNGIVTVFVSNIGIEDVRIHAILVDGLESPYTARDQDGAATDIIRAGELGVLEITGSGRTVHVVATSGKLFEFFVPPASVT